MRRHHQPAVPTANVVLNWATGKTEAHKLDATDRKIAEQERVTDETQRQAQELKQQLEQATALAVTRRWRNRASNWYQTSAAAMAVVR